MVCRMIKILKRGSYQLYEIDNFTKMFCLDNLRTYKWMNTTTEFFENQNNIQPITTLAIGRYFLYDVNEEEALTNLQHLELYLGKRTWQGYLLPGGLPTKKEKKKKIVPTEEIITKSSV